MARRYDIVWIMFWCSREFVDTPHPQFLIGFLKNIEARVLMGGAWYRGSLLMAWRREVLLYCVFPFGRE